MDTSWIAIDFETANERRNSVCALGLALVRDGRVAEQRHWLVRPPELRFNWMNVNVHGITAEDVEDAPEFCEIHDEVFALLDGARLIAHNAPFDVSVLRAALDTYGLEWPDARWWCTLAMARRVWPGLPDHKLDSCAGHCGVAFRHHDAAEDARACAHVALGCAAHLGLGGLDDLVGHLGLEGRAL